MKRYDRYIIIALVLLIIASYTASKIYHHAQSSDDLVAVIYKDGEVYQRVNLSRATDHEIKVIDVNGSYNTIEVNDGRIQVSDANCPNRICVNSGWLSKSGQISVCAPHRVRVVIEGNPGAVDTTAY